MNSKSLTENSLKPWHEIVFVLLAFLLWAVMFRDYLSSKLALFDDAVSYYDHVKFYLDNISRGVFPLWDPLWFNGAPNNFFLQRMGCFNPLLLSTIVFKWFGFAHTTVYLFYLMFYYFVGCAGFYMLARLVLREQNSAFVAFSLLLFSALGTRLFDSFMILMFTPIVWFFYFSAAFVINPRRYSLLGMAVTVFIVLTTYIPFYFIVSVVSCFLFVVLFYFKALVSRIPECFRFCLAHKILTFFCAAIVLASCVPGYLFFKAGGRGEYVMPKRNYQGEASVLSVQRQDNEHSWAVLEEFYFAGHYYADIRQIKFAVIYMPFFAFIIFLLGLLTRMNKFIVMLFLWICALLLMCVPLASPVYAFLYERIFFFKYFRNLHFFLWVTLLPAVCLLLAAQLKSFLSWNPQTFPGKWAGVVYLSVIHGLLAWFLYRHDYPVVTSYLTLIVSYVFLVWRIFSDLPKTAAFSILILLAVIAVEPLEIYSYLSRNTMPYHSKSYSYDFTDLKFQYTRNPDDLEMALEGAPYYEPERMTSGRYVRPLSSLYYASRWYSYLDGNIDFFVLRDYKQIKFILYDRVERWDDEKSDFLMLEKFMKDKQNVAVVASDDPNVLIRPDSNAALAPRMIEHASEDFQVVGYNVNHVKIKTNLSRPQFLVYNDSYHDQWSCFINGRRVPVVRANVAFKGVWVPAGQQIVEFKYGSLIWWSVYLGLFITINAAFVLLLYYGWRESKLLKEGADLP